jgi:hypothetical protein
MSSIDSPAPEVAAEGTPFRSGFDPGMRDRRAECDGGRHFAGTKYAGRQEFTGTLTGDYRDFGPYPWRWYLMTRLTRRPSGYAFEAVWCDADSLVPLDDGSRGAGD